MQSSQKSASSRGARAPDAHASRRHRSRVRGGPQLQRRGKWACGTIAIDAAYERIANHLPLQRSKE